MGPQATAAIVAGVVSLLVTFGKVAWDALTKKQERRLTARAELDRYRQPLLSAVDDLGNRIDNIRNKSYLSYYLDSTRREMAIRSTSYRIGAYFAWIEILYGDSGQYRFDADPSTKDVNDKLKWVGATFAKDEFDRERPHEATSSRLMLWREEQRGLGELMRKTGRAPGCVGYSTFIKNYDECYQAWFQRFEVQLQSMFSLDNAEQQDPPSRDKSKPDSQRLALLQGILAMLLVELDIDKSVVTLNNEDWVESPTWATRSNCPEPTKYLAQLQDVWCREAPSSDPGTLEES